MAYLNSLYGKASQMHDTVTGYDESMNTLWTGMFMERQWWSTNVHSGAFIVHQSRQSMIQFNLDTCKATYEIHAVFDNGRHAAPPIFISQYEANTLSTWVEKRITGQA
jgi:hypothetical protein